MVFTGVFAVVLVVFIASAGANAGG